MAALTIERKTPKLGQDAVPSYCPVPFGVAAGAKIFAGGLVAVSTSTGFASAATTSTTITVIGVAERSHDNTGGADGAQTTLPRIGVFQFNNSASADLIGAKDVGAACYVVDDNTVALTSATNTRSKAGTICGVDANGVWVSVGIAGRAA